MICHAHLQQLFQVRDKSLMIASTTTFNGNNGPEDMTAKETWKVDSEGKMLTLEFTNKMSGNENHRKILLR